MRALYYRFLSHLHRNCPTPTTAPRVSTRTGGPRRSIGVRTLYRKSAEALLFELYSASRYHPCVSPQELDVLALALARLGDLRRSGLGDEIEDTPVCH
jgi:hypothetical protein